jgi:hypothetical protein
LLCLIGAWTLLLAEVFGSQSGAVAHRPVRQGCGAEWTELVGAFLALAPRTTTAGGGGCLPAVRGCQLPCPAPRACPAVGRTPSCAHPSCSALHAVAEWARRREERGGAVVAATIDYRWRAGGAGRLLRGVPRRLRGGARGAGAVGPDGCAGGAAREGAAAGQPAARLASGGDDAAAAAIATAAATGRWRRCRGGRARRCEAAAAEGNSAPQLTPAPRWRRRRRQRR